MQKKVGVATPTRPSRSSIRLGVHTEAAAAVSATAITIRYDSDPGDWTVTAAAADGPGPRVRDTPKFGMILVLMIIQVTTSTVKVILKKVTLRTPYSEGVMPFKARLL